MARRQRSASALILTGSGSAFGAAAAAAVALLALAFLAFAAGGRTALVPSPVVRLRARGPVFRGPVEDARTLFAAAVSSATNCSPHSRGWSLPAPAGMARDLREAQAEAVASN
ncbi:hypothetical protein [Streptomyces decoyicus]|uniref:hypothetical protein n=1 Tax=Streptomyces decoyicus TaxID=249567 RepID=UPI0038179B30